MSHAPDLHEAYRAEGEWPVNRAAFEQWLDPANFDAGGRQRRSLAACRDAVIGSP